MKNLFLILVSMVFAYTAKAQLFVYTPETTPVPVTAPTDTPGSETYRLGRDASYVSPGRTILTILSDPSTTDTYNCHAYAWYMKEAPGSPPRWMQYYSNSASASSYITDGSYIRVKNEPQSGKIMWPAPDVSSHTAVTTGTTGRYISKWGDGPLVEHAWNDYPNINVSEKSELLFYVRPENIIIQGSPTICGETIYSVDVYDPNDVDYWYLGSNTKFEFIPSSSTTNTTTVTVRPKSSASAGDFTSVFVVLANKFHRTDSKLITFCPTPVISGPSTVCSGSYSSYSVSNAPAGYTWGCESSLAQNPNNPNQFKAASSSSSGTSFVYIKNSSGVLIAQKEVVANFPTKQYVKVFPVAYNYWYDAFVPVNFYPDAVKYNWEWAYPYPSSEVYFYQPSTQPLCASVQIYGKNSYTLLGKTVNACGTASFNTIYFTFYIANKGSAGNSLAYPNPVSDILSVDVDALAEQSAAVAQRQAPTYDIRLYDEQGNILRQQKAKSGTVQFNVSNLPDGIYYLHIYDSINSIPVMQQIIVEH